MGGALAVVACKASCMKRMSYREAVAWGGRAPQAGADNMSATVPAPDNYNVRSELMAKEQAVMALGALDEVAEELHDDLRTVEKDLTVADFEGTEDARGHLSEARRNLRWTRASMERARAVLAPEDTPAP